MASAVLRQFSPASFIFRFFSANSRNLIKISSKRASGVGYSLVYKEYGDPKQVLQKTEFNIPQTVQSNEILVEMLAAPINPADLNMIQGTYAIKPQLPAVGGLEGVARVARVGDRIKGLRVGDWIIPATVENPGTWTTHKIFQENHVKKIPNDIPIASAATLSVNPCTAFRMLKDFESLRAGDSVIQNGANSGVGQAVIQIAKEMGLITVNIVRQRPNIKETKQWLKHLGAHHVLTDEELRNPEIMQHMKSLPQPKLAFNCIGGKIATETLRFLALGGTMVTYGGMSRQPVTIPTSVLIFKDVKLRGFWMTNWKRKNLPESQASQEMFSFLLAMIKAKTLEPPVFTEVSLDDYKSAVEKAFEPYINKKFIFVFQKIKS